MRRAIVRLAPGLIACLGCGGTPPAPPETEAQGAARVLAVARGLEEGRETRRAMAAYQQVIRSFPNTPEAGQAAERIARAQKDAVRQAGRKPKR